MNNVFNSGLPYVNLNGNSKDQLLEQSIKICEATRTLMILIAGSDIDHGRNAFNFEHREIMRVERMKDLSSLKYLLDRYEKISEHIAD